MRRLLLAVSILAVLLTSLSAQESGPTSFPAVGGPTPPGALRLVNPGEIALRVQVRLTSARGCDGPILATTIVAPRAATRISLAEAVCIRRESLDSGAPRFRGTWERKEIRKGVLTEVVL